MNEKDHITEPIEAYDNISHTRDDIVKLKDEQIPKICLFINSIIRKTGSVISWLSLLLIIIIVVQVLLRYLFNINIIKLEELQWHLYAIIIMFGLSYAMVNHSHVRVDILRMNFSPNLQRIIEIFGVLFFMIPFIYIVIDYGIDATVESFRIGESSSSPAGLPYRWIIKSVIPLSFILLLLASVSRIIRHLSYFARKGKNGN